MKGRLIIYDTSNYVDFPIGGQLTSISNFLLFMTEEKSDVCDRIILVGITTKADELGCFKNIQIGKQSLLMLPVAVAETDLSHTGKSLRLQFAKGLLKYGRKLKIKKEDCNYIHTPEAYGIVKLLNPCAKCVIFSHGSYFNMERGFRFFKKNLLIKKGFMLYIKWILKNAKMIFVLDEDSRKAYQKYNQQMVKVLNSVICESDRPRIGQTGQLIFVGRLSKDKNIRPIIEAVSHMKNHKLLIVGNGEEYENLCQLSSEQICFLGAVAPAEVKKYMKQADILVMNSTFEGIPMTILEAISLGLPVITTPVGGIPTVLRFGIDSEETDGSAQQILQKAEKIYASYENYSQNAYENSKRFDYKIVNRGIYGHLETFLE